MQSRNELERGRKKHFLYLLFDPEAGGDMFLEKLNWLSTDYMALHPRK
jgi:hypothetical protein